jgi:hypothetical protein
MHSFGESPSAVVESHLSQILEDNPHPKYSLSAKACQGILNRASRRGKKLPEPLENALRNQCHVPSKSEEDVVGGQRAFDSGGQECNTQHTARPNTDTPPPQAFCIQGNCIDRSDTAGCNGKGWTEGKSFTLNTVDRPAVAVDCRNGTESEINGTLQAKSNGGISYNCNNVVRV